MVHWFGICKLTSLLNVWVDLRINIHHVFSVIRGFGQSGTIWATYVQIPRAPTWRQSVLFHLSVSRLGSFSFLFACVSFLLVSFLRAWVSRWRANENGRVNLMEKIRMELSSASVWITAHLALSSMFMNQQRTLSKMSVSRNTHERLYIDLLVKLLLPETHSKLLCISPAAVAQDLWILFPGNFLEPHCCENQ